MPPVRPVRGIDDHVGVTDARGLFTRGEVARSLRDLLGRPHQTARPVQKLEESAQSETAEVEELLSWPGEWLASRLGQANEIADLETAVEMHVDLRLGERLNPRQIRHAD